VHLEHTHHPLQRDSGLFEASLSAEATPHPNIGAGGVSLAMVLAICLGGDIPVP
jgi:hypothetical protein